jgi:virginiamycin B lyase
MPDPGSALRAVSRLRSQLAAVSRLRSRLARVRRPRRFVPDLEGRLESRALLSAVKASALVASPAVMLPHEAVGSTYDIAIPGPKLGSTHEITVGPDGNFWITQMEQNRVVRLTLDGQFSFFPTGDGSMPHGIQFDAQGRLWITRQGANTITQMDLNGNIIANHTIPYPNSNPHGLTVAHDGKVWFTGREGNIVGYYDPATNAFQVFQLPNPNPNPDPEKNGNFPIYISEAPDGSMYFTDLLTSNVGRITLSGALTFYPLPSKFGPPNDARPIAVYVRPDGVAVVSEESGHAYAYITPDGRVTEYPLTPGDAKAAAFTYDRAGTLWVQYNTPDAIGMVQSDGSVTPFTIPTLEAVQHRITVGPDGALWYTELKADKIGRMVTGHEDGPPIDGVFSQTFQAKHGGVAYRAAFKQGRGTYDARYGQTVSGRSTMADRQEAISHFRENLQGAINKLAGSVGAPTFGVKVPPVTGPNIRAQFQFNGNRVLFNQTERIGGAIYKSSFLMTIGRAKTPSPNPTSLSSATAHYLEAVKVLTNQI